MTTNSTNQQQVQQIEVNNIDLRFSPLRLPCPQKIKRLRRSVQREGVRIPLVVSIGIEKERPVLIDGFKRLQILNEISSTSFWAISLKLDAAASQAAILQCNLPQQGVTDLEQAWVVRSLCRKHKLKQSEVGELLGHDKSWVCRRLKLAECLEAEIQNDIRLGLLSSTTARELSRLPRGNQMVVADIIRAHKLTSRQVSVLVARLLTVSNPDEKQAILADPLRFCGTNQNPSNKKCKVYSDKILRDCLQQFDKSAKKLNHHLQGQTLSDEEYHSQQSYIRDALVSSQQAICLLQNLQEAFRHG
jgi:ParB-like chromosome segregation protein Spo0J